LTAERLEKLKDAIAKKKVEHDELGRLSEKDLWCRDLDEFVEQWEIQLQLDAEIQTNIRRMGRRESKKIGAGRSRKPKGDDDYEPDKKSKGKAKATKAKAAPVKVEGKSAQRFADMFGGGDTKPKTEPDLDVGNASDNFSDDDFAALSKSKPAPKPASKPAAKPAATRAPTTSQSVEPEQVKAEPGKRVAASKARTLFDVDSDSDESVGDMLGDVGSMVKGIGAGGSSGRLSLHAMARPESSHDNSSLPKPRAKSSKTLDVDSPDDTNYEMLAKSSPHKTATKGDDAGEFSEDEPSSAPPPGLSAVKKPRGRPAGAKAKPKEAPKPKAKAETKSTTLSPAAKAYAAKKAVKKPADDDSDDDMAEPDSPAPRPAARGRPGRAAAARRPIVIDDEDSSMALEEDDEEDPFEMDDDDD
jgi:DNA topoisomerase-2